LTKPVSSKFFISFWAYHHFHIIKFLIQGYKSYNYDFSYIRLPSSKDWCFRDPLGQTRVEEKWWNKFRLKQLDDKVEITHFVKNQFVKNHFVKTRNNNPNISDWSLCQNYLWHFYPWTQGMWGGPGSVRGWKNGLRGTSEVLRDDGTDWGVIRC
jgi:hypothetical protein